MLLELHLKNLAVVSEAALNLSEGLTVISGETGAGKSLLIDALLLLTGRRADSGAVRHGADRAEVTGRFQVSESDPAMAWLREQELDEDTGTVSLRRIVRADGGSKAWINGRPAATAQLAELASRLLEIHGQHDQQALLQRSKQLHLLDGFARHPQLTAAVKEAAQAWQRLLDRQAELQNRGDVSDRLAFLQHQATELERESLQPEAIERLQSDHRLLANADSMRELLRRQITTLQGDDEMAGALNSVRRMLSDLQRKGDSDPELAGVASLLVEAETSLSEAVDRLERQLDRLDPDPETLAELDRQLSRLHELSRKHRCDVLQLQDRLTAITHELETLAQAEQELANLEPQLAIAKTAYASAADTLRQSRIAAATQLGEQVSEMMQHLGMEGGQFACELEWSSPDRPDPSGTERIELLVAANPGQPARPLRKVASGGELSRLSLAIEVVTMGLDPVPTMVFDEVDSGIGGAVAEAVGRRLRLLGKERQVLCVTHLPQVASAGHHHVQVQKFAAQGLTQSAVQLLDVQGREDEIARMLGGAKLTVQAKAAARALLESQAVE